MGKLQRLMEAREAKNELEYHEALDQLPPMWRPKFAELLCFAIQYIITTMDVRRGREGIETLPKNFYEIQEEAGLKFFAKSRGEASKNKPMESQSLDNSGLILFHQSPNVPYSSGRLFELYVNALNPNCNRLFQRLREGSSCFDPNNLDETCLFVNEPLGKNKVAKMLKTLCRAVDKPDNLSNHSCRGDAISLLFRNGFDSHMVQFLSEHASLESLSSYHHRLDMKDRVQMAIALQTGSLQDYEKYRHKFENVPMGKF